MEFGMLEVSFFGSFAFMASLLLTHTLIRYSEKIGMIDIPNKRSSHERPTTKGGGLAFFSVLSVVLLWFFFSHPNYRAILTPILIGGTIIILLGWLDDRRSLSAGLRLLVHFFVSLLVYGFATHWFQGHLAINFLPNLIWVNALFSLLYIAWFINLYNFMDGADGLASSTTVVGSLLMAVISVGHNSPELAMIYCMIAYTVGGFLFYNWSPARIFMGNTGSYFLGFLFGSLAIVAKAQVDMSFYPHIILFGFFIFDSTYIVFRRAFRREPLFRAHKMFIFQKLLAKGWSHRKVSVFYTMVVIFWLFPLANIALKYNNFGMIFVSIAYLPLLIFAIYHKAGEP